MVGQEVGGTKNQMMWAKEQDTISTINIEQDGQQLSLLACGDEIFGVWSAGLDTSTLMPQYQSNHFPDAHWSYAHPELNIETGGIVPIESSKPQGPLQFKMPSALDEAIERVSNGFRYEWECLY